MGKDVGIGLKDTSLILHFPQMEKVAWHKFSNPFRLFLKNIKWRNWKKNKIKSGDLTIGMLKALLILQVCTLQKCFSQVYKMLPKQHFMSFKGWFIQCLCVLINFIYKCQPFHFICIDGPNHQGSHCTLTRSMGSQSTGNPH